MDKKTDYSLNTSWKVWYHSINDNKWNNNSYKMIYKLSKGVGFAYTCTGFGSGFSGDQDRVGPLVKALNGATS